MLDIYKVLNILGEPTRLRIVNIINSGALNVTEIKDSLLISQANCSKHLKLMYEHGIVERHKVQKTVYYYISPRYKTNCLVIHPILEAFSNHDDSIADYKRMREIVGIDIQKREKSLLASSE